MLQGFAENFTVVFAHNQIKGKGQLGSKWVAENGKNLTFSMYYNASYIKIENQFSLNAIVSLSVFNVLKKINLPQLKIKWPNDILSGNKKICGILIENVVKNQNSWSSVIGIGLNVNQSFSDFPESLRDQAVSFKEATGKIWDRQQILHGFLNYFYDRYYYYLPDRTADIAELYLGKVSSVGSMISVRQGETYVTGRFKTITPEGYLLLEQDEGIRTISTGDIFSL